MTPIGVAPAPRDTESQESVPTAAAPRTRPVLTTHERRPGRGPLSGLPFWISCGVHLVVLLLLVLFARFGADLIPVARPPETASIQYIDLAFPLPFGESPAGGEVA